MLVRRLALRTQFNSIFGVFAGFDGRKGLDGCMGFFGGGFDGPAWVEPWTRLAAWMDRGTDE